MSQWFQTEVQGSPCPLIPVTGIHFFLSVSFAMENPPINILRRWCHLRLITGSSLLLNWSKTGEICWNHAVTKYSSYLCKILGFVIAAQGWLDGRMAYVPVFWFKYTFLIWLSPFAAPLLPRHQISVAWNYQLHQSLFAIERVLQWKVFMDNSKTTRDPVETWGMPR
jgi:hypothetical protein